VGESDCRSVYLDVVAITEIQESFPGELGLVVSDGRVRDPKVENDALDKAYHFLGADLSQGPSLNLFSELVDHDKQVGEAPGCFLEESQEVQAPHSKRPCDGDGLEPLGRHVDLSCKVLEPLARPHDLDCIIGGRWPVKVLL
jgi:hypothetical protein